MNGVDSTDRARQEDRRARRRALEEELHRIQEQKAAIERQLAALRGGVKPASVSKAATKPSLPSKPGKRPASKAPVVPANLSREAKRQKVEQDRSQRVAKLWGQCSTILKGVKKHQFAGPFNKPVDPVALHIPDYFNYVTKPMDMGTISDKLEHKPDRGIIRKYKSPMEFRDDMRQVWENCRLYNRPGQQVRNMGDALSDAWEKRWQMANIEAKWDEEMQKQKIEDLELEGGSAVPHKMKEMDRELRQLQDKAEQLEPRPLGPPGTRKMTFEEKRRLSQHLGGLPATKLDRVLEIVAESAELQATDGEYDLDLESLDDETCWKLQSYVESVVNDGKPPEAAKSGGGRSRTPTKERETAAEPLELDAQQEGRKGGSDGARAAHTSSSSSASGSSSESDSDSEDEAGSNQNKGSAFGDPHPPVKKHQGGGGGGGAHDLSTLVSGTHPANPQILKNTSQKKEVTLQNANAWATLSSTPAEEETAEEENGSKTPADDALWNDFQNREQQQSQRDAEKREEEERLRKAREARDAQAREEAERRKREAAEAAAAAQREAQEAREEAQRKLEEQREQELSEMKKHKNQADFMGQQTLMNQFVPKGQGNALSKLGLTHKSDSDAEDGFEDDDDDHTPMDAEEGEVI